MSFMWGNLPTQMTNLANMAVGNDTRGPAPSAPRATAPLATAPRATAITSATRREPIQAVKPVNDDGSSAAGLLTGQTGLILDPLGRRGSGGAGHATLLGR